MKIKKNRFWIEIKKWSFDISFPIGNYQFSFWTKDNLTSHWFKTDQLGYTVLSPTKEKFSKYPIYILTIPFLTFELETNYDKIQMLKDYINSLDVQIDKASGN